jgi:Tfp pilus assembly PilM family ATPase
MLQFLKDRTCSAVPILNSIAKSSPIGVDMGDDTVTMAQLVNNGNGMSLIAGACENRPPDIKPGSVDWQRWAIKTIRQVSGRCQFRGRDVIAAIPPAVLFIDHIKIPKIDSKSKTKDEKDMVDNAVVSKIKQKLPFESGNAMIKYIPAEEDNALVIAAERKIIDRHLAVYEKADLAIKSIGVWPIAMAKSYTLFFGRRQADIEAVVYLLDIEPNCTNVVICRHENLLLARSIPLGANQLDGDEMVARFVLELDACRRHFASMYRKAQIERLVFLSGRAVGKDICVTIAKQLEMSAQMGDCLAAVEADDFSRSGVDRRNCQAHWAVAFGLSLS